MLRVIAAGSALGLLMLTAFSGSPAIAASFKYTTFSITLNPPGQLSVMGIDAAGDVVGYVSNRYKNKSGTTVAFAYVSGKIKLATPIDGKFYSYASAVSSDGLALLSKERVGKSHVTYLKWNIVSDKTSPLYTQGAPKLALPEYINAGADVVGLCGGGDCFDSGSNITLMTPGAYESIAGVYGVNDAGFSAGNYDTGDQTQALFTYENGTTKSFTIPNSTGIDQFGGVASNNAVVGSYGTSLGVSGFTLIDGIVTSFSYPGSTDTMGLATNSSGQIVGTYSGGSGFLYQNGTFYSLNIPNSTSVFPNVMNDQGTIAGSYTPTNSTYAVGFIATCATGPSTCTP